MPLKNNKLKSITIQNDDLAYLSKWHNLQKNIRTLKITRKEWKFMLKKHSEPLWKRTEPDKEFFYESV